ncbi:MAG: transglycosylase SLT domain-containing protein, partial [Chloroflexota bacterium]
GIPGLADNTYRVRVVDGAEAGRALVSSLVVVTPLAEVRRVGTKPPPAPGDIESVIRTAAAAWGADPSQLLRVAWCESRYNPYALNARSGAAGLFQFMPATWAANSVRAGYAGASVFDPVASANTAAYMFRNGQAWQWSCK